MPGTFLRDCGVFPDLTLGLNFQVEHHLFPEIPRRNLRAIQPRVSEQ